MECWSGGRKAQNGVMQMRAGHSFCSPETGVSRAPWTPSILQTNWIIPSTAPTVCPHFITDPASKPTDQIQETTPENHEDLSTDPEPDTSSDPLSDTTRDPQQAMTEDYGQGLTSDPAGFASSDPPSVPTDEPQETTSEPLEDLSTTPEQDTSSVLKEVTWRLKLLM
ncbi:proteoglycan 4-like [Amblyraja radiata]|uniref:proteoglycan 4-like n=1 Tax=Amblyraja radiata TaxID=386614 RepID=UPI0014025D9D|nr:proteoglycan 4-like [Amblyraja radiata]